MSRVCDLTGKSVVSGNNVSHAMNRTAVASAQFAAGEPAERDAGLYAAFAHLCGGTAFG